MPTNYLQAEQCRPVSSRGVRCPESAGAEGGSRFCLSGQFSEPLRVDIPDIEVEPRKGVKCIRCDTTLSAAVVEACWCFNCIKEIALEARASGDGAGAALFEEEVKASLRRGGYGVHSIPPCWWERLPDLC